MGVVLLMVGCDAAGWWNGSVDAWVYERGGVVGQRPTLLAGFLEELYKNFPLPD